MSIDDVDFPDTPVDFLDGVGCVDVSEGDITDVNDSPLTLDADGGGVAGMSES